MRMNASVLLAAACIALSAWCASAADAPGPADAEAPGPTADAPKPAAPDEVDERVMRGADLTLPEILRAGGGFSYVMILLSVAVAAAGVYSAIECGRRRVLPAAERAKVAERLAAGDRAGARAALEGAPSFYARGVSAVLSREGMEHEDVRGLLAASGERDAAILRGRLATLPRLAATGALVGLLGTLVGMHQAFGVAAMEIYRPLHAYAAVFKGLVVSVFGVGLAVVALGLYLLLSARLERALAEAGFAFEEVALALRRAPGAGAAPAGQGAPLMAGPAPSFAKAAEGSVRRSSGGAKGDAPGTPPSEAGAP